MAINIEWQVKPPSKVRRTSEKRAELVRTIPSEEEEGEVNRRMSERTQYETAPKNAGTCIGLRRYLHRPAQVSA